MDLQRKSKSEIDLFTESKVIDSQYLLLQEFSQHCSIIIEVIDHFRIAFSFCSSAKHLQ